MEIYGLYIIYRWGFVFFFFILITKRFLLLIQKNNPVYLSKKVELIKGKEMDSGNYGCSHYKRRCKIRAPCCDEIFDCRHCHNDSKNSLEVDLLKRHDIPRHDIKMVVCSLCNTEQDVQQTCIQCGVCMGNYFCSKCNFFDDDVSKNQYHCDKCGICRTGGKENFFHCDRCGCCYSNLMKESHICIERAMHHNCPVCFEYIFDTTKNITVLPCGHTMHLECVMQMERHFQYSCPVCSRSYCDMSRAWEKLDEEVASTPMPEMYQNKMVWILCNDCAETSEVNFHIVAHKCPCCKSYNTRQTRGGTSSCTNITEMVR
ncbi:PREDICTED: E3 ubiquitin-protein ligase MIEL1-like [Nicotiana attenuata]|uniref:E3 ubiquitin-protein ligase miel1 n=1 Tax=Nicotiana attenuata TaxID=49451 RepID=A0A1J6IAC1_NICAT|nr:PREDICTED: E3 ubiquitin-protein ligase MIEL1-like [Nicotiana attenuata]OIT01388.1 e3 ubiquitin-protein ligase miel1 [Nicotiana attenuata]